MERKELRVYRKMYCELDFITKDDADAVMDTMEKRIKELEARIKELEALPSKLKEFISSQKSLDADSRRLLEENLWDLV